MCPVCGKQFHRSDYLKLHLFSHTTERPFACNICGKGFKMKYNLNSHLKTHQNEKNLVTHEAGYEMMANTGDDQVNQLNNTIYQDEFDSYTNDTENNNINETPINLNLNDPKLNSIVSNTSELVGFYMHHVDSNQDINHHQMH